MMKLGATGMSILALILGLLLGGGALYLAIMKNFMNLKSKLCALP